MSTSALMQKGESSLERIVNARCLSDELFGVVRDDSLYARPIPERHRIVFYIGHLEAFDWNLLKGLTANRAARSSQLPNLEQLDQLFAFGIDPVDGGLPKDQPGDWPGMDVVRNYVTDRRQAVDDILNSVRLGAAGHGPSPETLLHVAVEHRLMHLETLAYMFHQLPYGAKHQPPDLEANLAAVASESLQPVHMVEIPAGVTTLGLRSNKRAFGWDNEFEAHDVFVPAFAIDKYMITNAQFLRFVWDGGYSKQNLWRAGDWQWREQAGISHPVFWAKRGEDWFYRGMFGDIPLPLEWPVYVSYAEASAYANWCNQALPTEAQWQRAAYGTQNEQQRSYPWGEAAPENAVGNFDFRRWEPEPVTQHQETNRSAFGAVGMLGNGWEWTSSVFAPFPGFQPFSFYPGYSANFFDGKHFVMKGGSPRTAASLLRRSFRNWFQPHYQYMYAGFRCVTKAGD
jgi:gamma-glutamyl hercynylcysteine S-oxide synthase